MSMRGFTLMAGERGPLRLSRCSSEQQWPSLGKGGVSDE